MVDEELNNVLLFTLFNVVNNIVQRCYAGIRLDHIVQYYKFSFVETAGNNGQLS